MNDAKVDFIVIGPHFFNYAYSTVNAIRRMGYSVKFFEKKPFYSSCTYFQRKLFKMGFGSLERAWDEKWNSELIHFVHESANSNTKLLFLSGGVSADSLIHLNSYRKILVLWDSMRRYPLNHQQRVQLYDKVYAFEHEDLLYAKSTFGIKNIEYLPVGYDDTIYFPDLKQQRDIDISFVGTVTNKRFNVLESIAKYAHINHWKLAVYGQWYNHKWPWKTWKFKRKHPELFEFLNNYNIPPEKTADIYRRSKIVLNVNTSVHKSISPRTFEILATRSFQLMNEGQFSNGTINLDKDLVLYNSLDDLIAKIQYYLSHEEERIRIAEKGYWDCQKFSLPILLKKVIEDT